MNGDDIGRDSLHTTVDWVLIAGIGLAGAVGVGTGAVLWGVFVVLVAVVAALPALALGDRTATVAWPLLAVPSIAAIARTAGLYGEAAGYFVVVALALMVVIELESFTSVELSRRFAVVFSVMTTMALQGVWIVAQSVSDSLLATALLRSQTELQWDIVLVTVLATAVGVLYYGYTGRFGQSRAITVPEDGGPR